MIDQRKKKQKQKKKLWIDRSIEEEAGIKLRNRGEQATKEVSQTVVVTGSEFREN